MRQATEAERRHFQEAFDALEMNPYPTNPNVPPGAIKRLQASGDWRYKVSYR